MCDEKLHIRVTYRVMRQHGRKLRPTGWSRTTNAYRSAWSRWCVCHNARWHQLHRDKLGGYYIVIH